MPVGAAIGIGALASTSASIYATNRQSRANREAMQHQTRANDEALQVEREERDYDRQIDAERYAREQERLDRLERRDDERYTTDANFDRTKFNANAAYRATGKAALQQLAGLAGLEVGDVSVEQVPMLPTPAPIPSAPAMAGGIPPRRRAADFVPGYQPPGAMPSANEPQVGEDGLVELRMPAAAYQQFAQQYSPQRPRRRVTEFLPAGA